MRVLMTTDAVGGVWTVTCELTAFLLSAGHAVALANIGPKPSAAGQAWADDLQKKYGAAFAFRCEPSPLEWMPENTSSYSGAAASLLRFVRDFRADLLHSHQFCWGALPVALPRMITAHSDVMSWADACRPAGLPSSPWLDRYRTLVQRGLAYADAVVSPSAWMRRALHRHFDVRCHSFVIPNGRTVYCGGQPARRRLQAVSVGRLWDDAKGLGMLFDVRSKVPILVAGEESFAASSVVTHGLRALGRLEESAILSLFRESSIYIATSIYEPFGLAPLEAALCGCAILARDIPSLREVWGDAALFYTTPQELSALLDGLGNEPLLLLSAQRKARDRASYFTAARMAKHYLQCYGSLLAGGRPVSIPAEELSSYVA